MQEWPDSLFFNWSYNKPECFIWMLCSKRWNVNRDIAIYICKRYLIEQQWFEKKLNYDEKDKVFPYQVALHQAGLTIFQSLQNFPVTLVNLGGPIGSNVLCNYTGKAGLINCQRMENNPPGFIEIVATLLYRSRTTLSIALLASGNGYGTGIMTYSDIKKAFDTLGVHSTYLNTGGITVTSTQSRVAFNYIESPIGADNAVENAVENADLLIIFGPFKMLPHRYNTTIESYIEMCMNSNKRLIWYGNMNVYWFDIEWNTIREIEAKHLEI